MKLIIPEYMKFSGVQIPEVDLQSLGMKGPSDIDKKAWHKARLGKITGSKFSVVKKSSKGEWSESADTYLYELVSEWITGETADSFSNQATNWGNTYENDAINLYQKINNKIVEKGYFHQCKGFKYVGATPDGLVGKNGIVEVKCPFSPKNHIRTLLTGLVPSEYQDQVDGHMLVTGRKWCDYVSYDPRMPNNSLKIKIIRVHRDSVRIASLITRLKEFEEHLLSVLKMLKVPNF